MKRPLLFVPMLALACGEKDAGDTGSADLVYENIGTFGTTDTDNITDEFEFTVRDDATAVVVYCGNYGDQLLGALSTLTDPGGATFFDHWNAPSGTPFRGTTHDDMVPFMIPNSPDADLSGGTWGASVWVESGFSNLNCKMVSRVGSIGSEVVLDVVFVGVDDYGLSQATAGSDTNWQAVEAEVVRQLQTAGLTASFQYSDFGGSVDTYRAIDGYGEFNDLLRTGNGDGLQVVTLFIVESIALEQGTTTLGKSGGPPGAATIAGTSKSGVVAVGADVGTDPTLTAKIIAHELGHYLGLWHTTERDGSSHDPLSDTPQCTDDGGDGVMNSSDCGGKGAENTMFWTANENTVSFSDDQGWVMERNPSTR